MIHVGLNTVELDGKYYETYVKDGDAIKAGQKLLSFDMKGIKEAGYDLTTPVIVTNADDFKDVRAEKTGNTMVLDKMITVE